MSCCSLALGTVPGERGYYWSGGGSRPRRHVRPCLSSSTTHDYKCERDREGEGEGGVGIAREAKLKKQPQLSDKILPYICTAPDKYCSGMTRGLLTHKSRFVEASSGSLPALLLCYQQYF